MIIHKETLYDYLRTWIRACQQSSGHSSILCVATGGLDSTLNTLLCLKATTDVVVNVVFMGFKPTEEQQLKQYIVANFSPKHYKIIEPTHPTFNDPALNDIDARKSLIPTYVDLYSKVNDCCTFGAITRSEYNLVKFFASRVDDCYDYYPQIDLYKSEVAELLVHIGYNYEGTSITEQSFGFTYEELEWLDREDVNLSVVRSMQFPALAPHWGFFNDRKKLLLTKVYQLNKANKSKEIAENKTCKCRKALPGVLA